MAESSAAFAKVPIEIRVSVGKARPRLSELLSMGQNDVLALDQRIDDPVELYVGDRMIARGILEEAEGDAQGMLAVRLTEVSDAEAGLA